MHYLISVDTCSFFQYVTKLLEKTDKPGELHVCNMKLKPKTIAA